jgi:hypothetical protein
MRERGVRGANPDGILRILRTEQVNGTTDGTRISNGSRPDITRDGTGPADGTGTPGGGKAEDHSR